MKTELRIAENIVLQTKSDRVETEGVSRRTYEMIYKGQPPWEICRSQPILLDLIKEDEFLSPVLDIGCGYGSNAIFLAQRGYQITAIDYLPKVIQKAKRENSHLNIKYKNVDFFTLTRDELPQYKTILDSATFHGFSDNERQKYVKKMREELQEGAYIYILGCSEKEKKAGGPRRLSAAIFAHYFKEGFEVVAIRDVVYETTIFGGGLKAILAKLKKIL